MLSSLKKLISQRHEKKKEKKSNFSVITLSDLNQMLSAQRKESVTLLLITFKRLESVALDVSERLITIVLLKLLVPLLETDQKNYKRVILELNVDYLKFQKLEMNTGHISLNAKIQRLALLF